MKQVSLEHWAAAALAAASFTQISAAQEVNVYRYDDNSANLAGTWTPGIGDTNYGFTGFNMDDDQPTRWRNLFSSGYVRGPSANSPVRGRDVSEDLDINWATPALEEAGILARWQAIDTNSDNVNNSWNMQPATALTGPHPGESFRTSPNLLAMDSEHALFLDDDGGGNYSLSFYNHLSGNLAADYTWTSLSEGGILGDANTPLSPALFSQYFIGSENNWMAFLVGPSEVEYYRRDNGRYIRTTDYSAATQGPLATYTLADIVDGKVPDQYFVGMDIGPIIMGGIAPVPEPSTGLLALCGAGLLARRRRASR